MTKKITVLTLVLTILLTSCWKKNNKIKIAVEGAYPPFSKTEPDGSISGFDIDIAKVLCQKMEIECELVAQEWDGMIPGLVAKKYDAIIASMSITTERKEKVNFTKKYYATTSSFVGPKGSEVRIVNHDLAANKPFLKGKTIGVQKATISDHFITDNYQNIAEVRRYASQEEANLDLISGRLDLIFVDTVAILDFLKPDQDGKNFQIIGDSFDDEKWFGEGIGIAIRKEDDQLLEKFNQAIDEIRSDETYNSIQSSYFDFDIYGN